MPENIYKLIMSLNEEDNLLGLRLLYNSCGSSYRKTVDLLASLFEKDSQNWKYTNYLTGRGITGQRELWYKWIERLF